MDKHHICRNERYYEQEELYRENESSRRTNQSIMGRRKHKMHGKFRLLSQPSYIFKSNYRGRRSKIKGYDGFNEAEITAQTNLTVDAVIEENKNPNEEENQEFKANYNGTIWHEGFAKDDIKQKMVQYAYKLGGYDLVALMECENGNWNIHAIGDSGRAYGLCQMNTRYHKLPSEYYDSWQVQVELCYQKRKNGTKFYGPSRIVKGKRCSEYVKSRFTFTE